jgi:hypothetical protein
MSDRHELLGVDVLGYGDIVPKTEAGRFCGIAIMFTGIAVLGVLAGSLAAVFHLDEASGDSEPERPATGAGGTAIDAELAALQADLRKIEVQLGELAQRARATPRAPEQKRPNRM